MNRICVLFLLTLLTGCSRQETGLPLLTVSGNGRFLATEKGDPFFWLGDTGWLLFKKLSREQSEKYLEDRKQKGFNVIQVMLIHDINNTSNAYGDSAVINRDLSKPCISEGADPADELQYDYWDHVDFVIRLAGEKGIYMALVPVWGSNVRGGNVTAEQAAVYASFLAKRYRDFPNVIWLNGGDVAGSDSLKVWQTIGKTIKDADTDHLMTFHPFGRTMSSDWFHNESWLDFNMFQSGHRRYDQDNTERCYGEDNWRYVYSDYNRQPVKPTVDGEPSYEHIPQGLHDGTQPRWNDADTRRYAYWSVFAGAFGHTYGHSSIMQFYSPGDTIRTYYATKYWEQALDEAGGNSMKYLKELILSKPFFSRVPDQSLIRSRQGEKYGYLAATRGDGFALVYTYNGKSFSVDGTRVNSSRVTASWFNPRNGESIAIGTLENGNNLAFDPPGDVRDGNDWVLVIDAAR
ncbi:MAG: glycoside hydrolase family 140 protein [Bacteroidales bacterium]|nr:glycoside hydrolase family 140 protein [Bacteroidales bacterium]